MPGIKYSNPPTMLQRNEQGVDTKRYAVPMPVKNRNYC
jgi:hypothetical protein